MWNLSLPWWEFVVRALVVYVFLLVLLRITGKRQVGQLDPFDLVLLLVLSNAVQNSMNGNDSSVLGGMILSITLVGANFIVSYLTYRSKKLEGWIEGRPVVLIHHGKVIQKSMDEVKLTIHELNSSLRANGCTTPEQVLVAILENNGEITVIPKHHATETPSHHKPEI